jgi:hypothetical protein
MPLHSGQVFPPRLLHLWALLARSGRFPRWPVAQAVGRPVVRVAAAELNQPGVQVSAAAAAIWHQLVTWPAFAPMLPRQPLERVQVAHMALANPF